jgi:hypothetical protein
MSDEEIAVLVALARARLTAAGIADDNMLGFGSLGEMVDAALWVAAGHEISEQIYAQIKTATAALTV